MRDVDNNNVTAEVLEDMVDEQRIVYNWQHIGVKRSKKRYTPGRQAWAFASILAILGVGIWASVSFFNVTDLAPSPLSFELSEVHGCAGAEHRSPLRSWPPEPAAK